VGHVPSRSEKIHIGPECCGNLSRRAELREALNKRNTTGIARLVELVPPKKEIYEMNCRHSPAAHSENKNPLLFE
jgi:hypothetical protein